MKLLNTFWKMRRKILPNWESFSKNAKQNIQNVDPVVNSTTVVNVYSEDDFDEQFEALSKALAEEE